MTDPVSGAQSSVRFHVGWEIEAALPDVPDKLAATLDKKTYQPGETRHETYGKGEFKVHDLANLSDHEIVFMTVEFKDSANKPMPLPAGVRPQAAA